MGADASALAGRAGDAVAPSSPAWAGTAASGAPSDDAGAGPAPCTPAPWTASAGGAGTNASDARGEPAAPLAAWCPPGWTRPDRLRRLGMAPTAAAPGAGAELRRCRCDVSEPGCGPAGGCSKAATTCGTTVLTACSVRASARLRSRSCAHTARGGSGKPGPLSLAGSDCRLSTPPNAQRAEGAR